MVTKLFERTDSSGLVTIAVFQQRAAAPQAHFHDLAAEVDPAMVVVGGGATAAEGPNGALLTASYPNDGRSAWLASSKDHRVPNPHRLTVFAIGMRINSGDMPRGRLLENLFFARTSSAPANHPRATASAPDDFTMLGGGFRVNWPPGAGNLATGSFPDDIDTTNNWSARSKDHVVPSPCTIDVWSIALRSRLTIGGRGFRVERRIGRMTSTALVPHPTASFTVDGPHVLTGVGAKARVEEPGQLIWRIEPTEDGRPGVTGSSKDHEVPLRSVITVSAVSIRLV
jgi:hypothetical protein